MKTCKKCRAIVEDTFSFCCICGADLKVKGCDQCGKELPQTANFCPWCGFPASLDLDGFPSCYHHAIKEGAAERQVNSEHLTLSCKPMSREELVYFVNLFRTKYANPPKYRRISSHKGYLVFDYEVWNSAWHALDDGPDDKDESYMSYWRYYVAKVSRDQWNDFCKRYEEVPQKQSFRLASPDRLCPTGKDQISYKLREFMKKLKILRCYKMYNSYFGLPNILLVSGVPGSDGLFVMADSAWSDQDRPDFLQLVP